MDNTAAVKSKEDGTILEFLHGEKSFMGVWFGEQHPDYKGAFWWRRFLPNQFTTDREWVSVGERLPTGGIRCWVCQNWTYVNEGYYEDNRWKGWTDYEGLDFVTHWKEFTEPEPPKNKLDTAVVKPIGGMWDNEVTGTLCKNGWEANPTKWYIYGFPNWHNRRYTAHIGYPTGHPELTRLCIYEKGKDSPINGVIADLNRLTETLTFIKSQPPTK